ncbi:MAG: Uma2 family endonuclease [Cytophagaceae bacterium]|nr:Uma2 family endonuclease [Cytophagaceae bacterium]
MSAADLLERPDVYLILQRIQEALDREKAERQRFYETVDENQKMEFINGQIVFQSPVKRAHNSADGTIYRILDTFVTEHDLGWVGIEKILVSLTRNDYEPDVCFWKTGKAEAFDDKQMQFPAPDLAVEVLSKSTAKTDRETKFNDYEAHGVSEYWIVDSEKHILEQYVLEDGRYELRMKSGDGMLTCEAIARLAFPVEAIFDKKLTNKIINRILAEK